MLALVERPRNAEVEVRGQRLADTEAGGQSPVDARGQRSEGQKGSESKSRGPKLAGSGPELEDK